MNFLLIVFLMLMQSPQSPRVVEVSAKRFEFNPKEIHLKAGEPVTIRLVATDHAHGLLVKPLGIDLDAKPDSPAEITITPDAEGTFNAICDHYCGVGHGNMKMKFIVANPAGTP